LHNEPPHILPSIRTSSFAPCPLSRSLHSLCLHLFTRWCFPTIIQSNSVFNEQLLAGAICSRWLKDDTVGSGSSLIRCAVLCLLYTFTKRHIGATCAHIGEVRDQYSKSESSDSVMIFSTLPQHNLPHVQASSHSSCASPSRICPQLPHDTRQSGISSKLSKRHCCTCSHLVR